MDIDTTVLAILIVVLLSILSGGVWLGRMSEKVRNNRHDLEEEKEMRREEAQTFRQDNRQEHKDMMVRIDKALSNCQIGR